MFFPEGVDVGIILSQSAMSLLIMFLLGSMLGYLIEVLFRRFVSAKRWVNPGFMRGPWLPLYGFGVVLMFLFTSLFQYVLSDAGLPFYDPWGFYGTATGANVYDLIPIAVIGVSLTLLEFVAGLIFVKGFKVRLWDYTNMRGNVMGIICPLFSVIWLLAAIVYYYLLNPGVSWVFGKLYGYLFQPGGGTAHIWAIYFLGLVYGLMLYDLVVSIGLFDKVTAAAKKSGILTRYEKWREDQKENLTRSKARFLELLPASLQERAALEKKEPLVERAKQSAFMRAVNAILLVDPNKKKNPASNYDENGRPVSFEDDGSKGGKAS